MATALAIAVPSRAPLQISEGTGRVANDGLYSGDGDSTGSKIWDSGRLLSSLLSTKDLSGVRVLELGSGTGVGGLTAAGCGASVCLTDGSAAMLDLLRQNIEANGLERQATVQRLRWGDADECASVVALGPFDLIVGSDLLYAPEAFPNLLETLAALCTPERTEILLTYPTRFTEGIFFEQAAAESFEELDAPEECEPCLFASRLVLRE